MGKDMDVDMDINIHISIQIWLLLQIGGVLFWGPYMRDSIVGSYVSSHDFWKLSNTNLKTQGF